MAKYEIRYGLGGGFGGPCEWEDCEAETLEEAEAIAYDEACQVYDSYDGMYGLQTENEIMEENPDFDEEDAAMEWREQRESWLDYEARAKQ